jgi:hypothetical protein
MKRHCKEANVTAKSKVSSKDTSRQGDFLIELLLTKFKQIDEILEIARERIEGLGFHVYCIGTLVRKLEGIPYSLEALKKFASGLNIDLDSLRAECEKEATESPGA